MTGARYHAAILPPAHSVQPLGKWVGNGPALWLGMQQAFDVWHAELALGAELERIPGHAA